MEILNYENFYKSKLLVEQHFHGCFGVDFSTCEAKDILFLAKKLLTHGIGGFYPTLVTDTTENIKRQIERIKTARKQQTSEMAEILGIHLEGIFINPEKKGIHNEKLFLKPTVENYKLIEDDFIKIVTLAPELDENGNLREYLRGKGVKVQAGHCVGADLSGCSGVTHLFNAMSGITHRQSSTALSALVNDNIYTEIIADGVHLSGDILKLVFKSKPEDKVILVSDSLPLAKSGLKEMTFAGEKIFYDGKKATSADGTIAGSTAILDEIVKNLALNAPKNFEKYVKMASDNLYAYHNVELEGCVYWGEDFEIVAIEKDGVVLYKGE
ncbi:MAG: amidohydrolase family protein [Candidatus Gastranaerophilaceae bacterium]